MYISSSPNANVYIADFKLTEKRKYSYKILWALPLLTNAATTVYCLGCNVLSQLGRMNMIHQIILII